MIGITPGFVSWKTPDGHSPLATFFNTIHPLSKEAIASIDRDTFPVTLRKGNFLVKPGSSSNDLYLVLKGVIRGYIKEEGKEITTWINEENEVVGSIRNLGLEIDSDEYVQAIEDAELIAIPHALITYLYANFPEANIIGRILLEENYRGAEERAYISRIPSAEKKYKRFVATRGSLLNRIPLKYIASYLGMTLETMSRIRSKKN
ncbi:MAG: Crp/Fnr family transcriptional regulator [Bacteroidota bacterium]